MFLICNILVSIRILGWVHLIYRSGFGPAPDPACSFRQRLTNGLHYAKNAKYFLQPVNKIVLKFPWPKNWLPARSTVRKTPICNGRVSFKREWSWRDMTKKMKRSFEHFPGKSDRSYNFLNLLSMLGIRIRMFWRLPVPDPLERVTDPDLSSSKYSTKTWFLLFCDFFWKNDQNVPSKGR